MRTSLRRFQTFMVDEFRTSRMCSKCEVGICKKMMLGKVKTIQKERYLFLVHGLLIR